MKHARVAIDLAAYEQRIASLEADNRAMGQAIMEMAALIETLVGMAEPEAKRKRRKAVKACQVDENSAKIERQGGALASPTLPNRDAVEKGQANGC